MSYNYPPFPAPPVIPTELPAPNLVLAGVGDTNPFNLSSAYDVYLIFVWGATLRLPIASTVKCKRYEVKNWGGTSVTIIPTAPESIDSAGSYYWDVTYGNLTIIPWASVGWMIV